jgi:hypothetical protein
VAAHAELTLAINKEVCGLALLKWEDVVVEIYILLVEILNAVEVQLNGVAVECRKELLRDYILVQHHVNLAAVNPLWHLAIARYHEVHLADKGHVHRYATHKVAQRTPVTEALLENRDIGMLLIILLPKRI